MFDFSDISQMTSDAADGALGGPAAGGLSIGDAFGGGAAGPFGDATSSILASVGDLSGVSGSANAAAGGGGGGGSVMSNPDIVPGLVGGLSGALSAGESAVGGFLGGGFNPLLGLL